ncbi:site-specific recombinase XerC [Buttiauxella sp. BIGb0552]|uniref:Site-specific recombinase XerD n=1 Tax=Buttiauxella agrestis TaxID=82977 RepID=A0A381C6E1_9ENTR|nr:MULTISPECIES: tyrosine-type recombinase/integrase [Buttiauxella]TDX14817.1 site-specific recombinase XerC [Buttiauxella sp. BIGb0552]SUW63436.1 Site-specific recombinase XerD [Buttiauxella agrestis]
MTKRPVRYDANLPRNLTFRKTKQIYSWRNPITGQEISLGKIARKDAVAQAIEANNYLDQNYLPSSLLERIMETPDFTVSKWLERYSVILERRELKPNTMKVRRNQLATLEDEFGNMPLNAITTRDIATFLEGYIECDKKSMAVALRSVLSDIFREAIVEGHISLNPVEPTRAPTPKVKRERLILEQYQLLHSTAENFGEWVQRAFELALVTGQRREDISLFRFSDVRDDRLFIEQQKTGHKLALPLDLKLNSAGLVLGDVIDNCRKNNPSDFMLYSAVRRGGRKPGPLTPDGLTQAFAEVRNASGISFGANPPAFHEMRSLASREYEKEYSEDFAQRLLGHKNLTMTKKYLDSRGAEYVMV